MTAPAYYYVKSDKYVGIERIEPGQDSMGIFNGAKEWEPLDISYEDFTDEFCNIGDGYNTNEGPFSFNELVEYLGEHDPSMLRTFLLVEV